MATTLDRAFQALADPTRRTIIEQLMRGPRTVSELAEPFGMSLPAIGHHLRTLERGGLIRSEKLGRVRTCRVEPEAVLAVERWVAARRSDWQRRLGRLERLLDAPDVATSGKADRKESK